MYTALAKDASSEQLSENITLKYFEPGHMFMSVDSFYHQVELVMYQRIRVEDFQDFVKIVDSCGKSLRMSFNDFFEIQRDYLKQNTHATNQNKKTFKLLNL